MKKRSLQIIFYLLVLVVGSGTLFLSCEAEEQAEPEESTRLMAVESDLSNTAESTALGPTLTAAEFLEQRMQWASYIAARVLCEYDEARREVDALLPAGAAAISIDQLIADPTDAPVFYEAFIDYTYYYIFFIVSNGKPTLNEVIPPVAPTDPDLFFDAAVAEYIELLTVDNCIELYFPNNFPDGGTAAAAITSTAHPMGQETLTVNGDSNIGYRRDCGEGCIFGSSDKPCVRMKRVDIDYVLTGAITIVARPYRTNANPNCGYEDFDEIDFEDFLSI